MVRAGVRRRVIEVDFLQNRRRAIIIRVLDRSGFRCRPTGVQLCPGYRDPNTALDALRGNVLQHRYVSDF